MRGSSRIDMLWAPLNPVQGGKKGNELGNPYVNVKEVLAMWRDSVPQKVRKNWLNIDPPPEDRVLDTTENAAGSPQPAEQKEDAVSTATPSTVQTP